MVTTKKIVIEYTQKGMKGESKHSTAEKSVKHKGSSKRGKEGQKSCKTCRKQ
jgi:hypothetical protein